MIDNMIIKKSMLNNNNLAIYSFNCTQFFLGDYNSYVLLCRFICKEDGQTKKGLFIISFDYNLSFLKISYFIFTKASISFSNLSFENFSACSLISLGSKFIVSNLSSASNRSVMVCS